MKGENQEIELRAIEIDEKDPLRPPGWLQGGFARAGNLFKRRQAELPRATVDGEVLAAGPRTPNLYTMTFVLCVVVPSLASIFYFAFVASDQYAAEAHFAMQSPSSISGNSGGDSSDKGKSAISISSTGLPDLTTQDAYIVSSYVDSPAIIDDLKDKVDIRAIFTRPGTDFWARLKGGASREELNAYWKTMVGTYVESTSGIVTLNVRAFRPEDAQSLAQAIISASEKLANDVSARARASMMQQADEEVQRSEGLVRDSLADLRAFRDKHGFIDPIAAAQSTSILLMGAMSQEIALDSNYQVASKAMSPEAPTVVGLKAKLDEVKRQIVTLKSGLTGNSSQDNTISASLVEFESLQLKKEFAVKLNEQAQAALERAKLRAEQQNVFVSTFVPPGLPQEAQYPQRLALSILFPIGLAMLWGMFALLAASIEDHRY